jgi:hypothetical protein
MHIYSGIKDPACESLIRRRPQVAGRLRNLWDAWALAEVQSQLALNAWRNTARHLKGEAFAAYSAALEREEQAANALAARAAAS